MLRFHRPTGKRQAIFRPHIEILEDRTAPATLGPEFTPAAITDDLQFNADVAGGRDGLYVIVWQYGTQFGNTDIHARIINDKGLQPTSRDIVVAASTRDEREPAVDIDNKGNFVVAWSYDAGGGNYNIAAAQFSSTGARRNGRNFTIARQTWSETDPDVAVSGHGHMVISYHRRDNVYARMHNDNRAYVRDISVSTTSRSEHSAKVARSADGRFSIVYVLDINQGDIRLRRYNAAGNLMQQRTVATDEKPESDPTISMNHRGDTLVGWLKDFTDRTKFIDFNRLQTRMVFYTGRLGPVRDLAGGNAFNGNNIKISTASLSVQQSGVNGRFVVSYERENRNLYMVYDYIEVQVIATGELGDRNRTQPVSWSRNGYEALFVWGIGVGDKSGDIAARKLTI